jgi:nitrate reductase alpha subunit
MAAVHVILNEFHAQRQVPYFTDYLKRTTDSPFLVELEETPDGYAPRQFVRANRVGRYADVEHGDWKMLVWDALSDAPRMPKGTIGFRWAKEEKGKWNLKLEDGLDDAPIDPELSFLGATGADVVQVAFHEFASRTTRTRGVPARRIATADGGSVVVATVYDLLFAQFGVGRGLEGDYPVSYDDVRPYTPAWQEQFTGIGRDTVIQLAREFAGTAEATGGKSMVIIGASINHWYNNNLCYKAPITALILCGCCGFNGGGMNHYVGQEKLTLFAPWTALAFALDWQRPPRQQQSPTWHYVNSDQWRYEGDFTDYAPVPPETRWAKGHAMDLEAMSVRMGWMPYYPQFDRNPITLAAQAEAAGATTPDEVAAWVRDRIASGEVKLAVDDPDAEESWPRVWLIWRGNAISSSAKGHEFFLRHYLGTHDNVVAEEHAKDKVKTVTFREPAPRGKMDLVVDVNFRMDTSALYSDIVLPTASWYEKDDLNTTDLHSYVHPLQAAVPPVWESTTDWEIFKALAEKVSELAPTAFSATTVKDVVWSPLAHDTPDELAQTEVLDWRAGECEPVPGVTMPHIRVVERDYANLYNRFVSLGPGIRDNGLSARTRSPTGVEAPTSPGSCSAAIPC